MESYLPPLASYTIPAVVGILLSQVKIAQIPEKGKQRLWCSVVEEVTQRPYFPFDACRVILATVTGNVKQAFLTRQDAICHVYNRHPLGRITTYRYARYDGVEIDLS